MLAVIVVIEIVNVLCVDACFESTANCDEANLDVQYMMAVSQNTPQTFNYWNGKCVYVCAVCMCVCVCVITVDKMCLMSINVCCFMHDEHVVLNCVCYD